PMGEPMSPAELPAGVTVTYSRQFRRCGKADCPLCAAGGPGHGPYWYAYWREEGRARSRYLGKHPPPGYAADPGDDEKPPAAPARTAATGPTLRVRALGGLSIWRGDDPIPLSTVRARKALTLL